MFSLARNGSVLSLLIACADLTRPTPDRLEPPEPPQPAAAAKPPESPPADALRPTPADAPPQPALRPGEIGAAHVLVAFAGAARAKPTVQRNKQDARTLAESIAERARAPNADFGELARSYSDGPSATRGGDLRRFTRRAMVKEFSDAAFALRPGQISDVVETVFGFHVIKRTE